MGFRELSHMRKSRGSHGQWVPVPVCSVKRCKDRSALDASSKKDEAGGEIAKEMEETIASHLTRPQV